MKNFVHIVSHIVFWTWNLTFIGLIYLWLLPQVGFGLFEATRNGTVESTFTASLLALLLIPPICTLLGWLRLRKYPDTLMWLFYGVEAPLFTLCLLRLFLLRELTAASGFVLGMVALAIAIYTIELLTGYSAYRPRLALAQMIGHSLILVVGLYGGLLLLLYTVPATAAFATGFFSFLQLLVTNPVDVGLIVLNPISFLFGFIAIASVAVFVTMPYALVTLYVQAWARIRIAFGRQHGDSKSWTITAGAIALSALLFVSLQGQPQVKAFSLLNVSASVTSEQTLEQTVQDRQQQLQNLGILKAGLTNAYLHNYRYLSPRSQSNALSDLYRRVFHLSRENSQPLVRGIQSLHNALLSPFLYRGEGDDAERAAKLYAQVFDEPIQKAERNNIRQALQATANREETSAGLINLDQEVVFLASQTVNVTERGDWATVEIQEKYSNSNWEDQEIFYSFSLPESATITGLWLGDGVNPKLFPFVVSPRGAAQSVYNNEVALGQVREAVDPALLEQVGPRQYRLRVFPIPAAIPSASDPADSGPGELYLSMTYQTMRTADGWPLPQLTEKRSIYWNDKTERQRGSNSIMLPADEWFEAAFPVRQTSAKFRAKSHSVEGIGSSRVTATPLSAAERKMPTNQRLAIVVDSSYSMRAHTDALQQSIQQLKMAGNNTVDFYSAIANPPAEQSLSPTKDFDVSSVQFYGSLQPADLLQQFAQAQVGQDQNKTYDGVILLTDRGSYELADDKAELPGLSVPLWIVHIDGKLPSAYPDRLLQLLQNSQGGVETNLSAALQRIAMSDRTILDGYRWTVAPSKEKTAERNSEPDGFEAIAARQVITQRSRLPDVNEALDELHAIAQNTGIVTPYSSMIVLVDERQREALKDAEASADRFEREVETGEDALTVPGNPLSVSVPEPGQVVGLIGCAIALIFLKRRHSSNS